MHLSPDTWVNLAAGILSVTGAILPFLKKISFSDISLSPFKKTTF
jgi:hypothetical protein